MNLDFVLTILVLVLALAGLAYPLYRARTQFAGVDVSTLDDLLAQRDGVYATLRDLELDQALGKLDANDYASLRERYMLRATEILQQLDVLRGEGGSQIASAEIEKEVVALRKTTKDEGRFAEKRLATNDGEQRVDTNALVAQKSAKEKAAAADMFCTNCGRPYKPGDKFCARCGHALG
jgi:zinc-ribbon domain